MRHTILILFIGFSCVLSVSVCAADIIYVRSSASPDGDGLTWATAYNDLQLALADSESGDEIWVAAGMYKPTTCTDRTISFVMIEGVALYGGFPEEGGSWNCRDWEANKTVLSGDIGVPCQSLDDSFVVVLGADSAILDGFTITQAERTVIPIGLTSDSTPYDSHDAPAMTTYMLSGNSYGGMVNHDSNPLVRNCMFVHNNGGGMVNESSNPTVSNCMFIGNYAGDGMINRNSSPIVTGCSFTGNYGSGMLNKYSSPIVTDCSFARNHGGGMNNIGGSPTVLNCAFIGNRGGMNNSWGSDPSIVNCTFVANVAKESGGAISNLSTPTPMVNCIVWANTAAFDPQISGPTTISYSNVQGGWPGDGNINHDPLFIRTPSPGPDGIWGTIDDDYGDVRLQELSPCIDAGNNAAVPSNVITDLAGNVRIWDGIGDGYAVVDIAAYEYQPLRVRIDVLPGDEANVIRLQPNRPIAVAILGEPGFDVRQIDPASVEFGHGRATALRTSGHWEDANGDGITDLVLHFLCGESGIQPGDESVALWGRLHDGEEFWGSDSTTVIEGRHIHGSR